MADWTGRDGSCQTIDLSVVSCAVSRVRRGSADPSSTVRRWLGPCRCSSHKAASEPVDEVEIGTGAEQADEALDKDRR